MDGAVTPLALSLLAGSLTTLSPCVFPILPMVLGATVQGHRLAPLAMGAGMTLSFAGIGVFLGTVGPTIGVDSEHIRLVGAFMLMVCGAVLWVPSFNDRFAQWMLPLANGAHQISSRVRGDTLGGAVLLGSMLGLVWSPCAGPLLASAMALVATEGGGLRGAVMLGIFGFGAALPLTAVAYGSRRGLACVRHKVMAHGMRVRKIFGAVILATGLVIAMGADKWLDAQIVLLLPDAWLRFISGL